jgi:hypothetical protein
VRLLFRAGNKISEIFANLGITAGKCGWVPRCFDGRAQAPSKVAWELSLQPNTAAIDSGVNPVNREPHFAGAHMDRPEDALRSRIFCKQLAVILDHAEARA